MARQEKAAAGLKLCGKLHWKQNHEVSNPRKNMYFALWGCPKPTHHAMYRE
jgi:hypothetical protein